MAISSVGYGPEGFSVGFGSDDSGPGYHSQHERYQVARENMVPDMRERVRAAREAGLHPLFAMGANTGLANSPNFNMPGQSATGSFKDIGMKWETEAQKKRASAITRNSELRNQILEIEIANMKSSGGNNVNTDELVKDLNQKKINPALQEREKGVVTAHHPKSKQKGMGVRPLTNAIIVGDQSIQFAVEEAADIAEDPIKIIGAAMLDRNNQGVQWRKAIRDYAGWAHPRDYKARNLAERVITKKLFWGLAKYKRSYKIPRYMGR